MKTNLIIKSFIGSLLLACSPVIIAKTYTVNSVDDNDDAVLDGVCADNNGNCTLRAAIQEANNASSLDTIKFKIPGVGEKVIDLNAPLPDVTQTVIINGANYDDDSDSVSDDIDRVVIEGEDSFFGLMFIVDADSTHTTVKNLKMRTGRSGIRQFRTADNNIINCVFESLGTALTFQEGTSGGTVQNNLIKNHSGNGAFVRFATGVHFVNNTIDGTNDWGIDAWGMANWVIEGNTFKNIGRDGIFFIPFRTNPADGNLIKNNHFIGQDLSDGESNAAINFQNLCAFGTFFAGSANNNKIIGNTMTDWDWGGVIMGEDNVFCSRDDYSVIGNTIIGNKMSGNNNVGIDLSETVQPFSVFFVEPDGVTPNDLGDGDIGPNDLINYPVLTSASYNDDDLWVQGSLNTLQGSYRIDVYLSDSDNRNGKVHLGHFIVTTDDDGNASFSKKVELDDDSSDSQDLSGSYVLTTSTQVVDPNLEDDDSSSSHEDYSNYGSTSEFSAGVLLFESDDDSDS